MRHNLGVILSFFVIKLVVAKEIFSPAAAPKEQSQWNYYSPASLAEIVNRADFGDIDNNLVALKAPLLSILPVSYTLSDIVDYQAAKLPELIPKKQTKQNQVEQNTIESQIVPKELAPNVAKKETEKQSVKEKREQVQSVHKKQLAQTKAVQKIGVETNIINDKQHKKIVDTKVDTKGDKKVDAKPETKVDTKGDTKPETKVDAKVDTKQETKVNAKVDTKPETKVDAKVDTKQETKVNAKVDTKPETKVDAKVDTKQETKVNAKVDTKPETKVDAKVDTKQETKVDAKVDTKVDTKQEIKVDTKVDAKVDTKPETKVDKKVDVKVDTMGNTKVYTKAEKLGREESLFQIEEDNRPLFPFQKKKAKIEHTKEDSHISRPGIFPPEKLEDKQTYVNVQPRNSFSPPSAQIKENEVPQQTVEIELTNVKRKSTPSLIYREDRKEKNKEHEEKVQQLKEEQGNNGNGFLLLATVLLLSLMYLLSRRNWRKEGSTIHLRDEEDLQTMI